MLASWGTVLLLMIPAVAITFIRYMRDRNPALWMHLFIISVMTQCLIYFGLSRDPYPIEPFGIILAAMTVVTASSKITESISRRKTSREAVRPASANDINCQSRHHDRQCLSHGEWDDNAPSSTYRRK